MASALVSGRDYLRIQEAARVLGVTEQTLRNWDKAGRLRAHRHPINGYRLYRISDLRELLEQIDTFSKHGPSPQQLSLVLDQEAEGPQAREPDDTPPCHWSREVALDPKHRPQRWLAPSSTVRRDWRKFPQEAHVLDAEERRYRRLTVDEIALLQGIDPRVVAVASLTERQRIAALGDAVPPPVAQHIFAAINEKCPPQKRTVVEVCAGSGGLATGAAQVGFEHMLLLDSSAECGQILRNERPWPADNVVITDLRSFNFDAFRRQVGILSGGPPCQPWSQSGLHRGSSDHRDLLGTMPDLVSTLQPDVFVFENVPGLAMVEAGEYLRQLVQRLRHPHRHLVYGVMVGQLNAADYGVPQTRKRLFIIGVRDGYGANVNECFDAIERRATHADPAYPRPGRLRWRTVGDVLIDRPDPGGWRKWLTFAR
jgi:excisionase family DNA binding protein